LRAFGVPAARRRTMNPSASVRFLQLAAFLAPLLAVLAPRSLAVLLPVAAVGAGLGAWHERKLSFPPLGPTIVMVAVLVWGAASAAWAFEPKLVWSVWPQIAGLAVAGLALVAVGLRVDEHAKPRVGGALASGVVLAVIALGIEWVSSETLGHPLTAFLHQQRPYLSNMFNRGAAAVAVLVWPAAVAVWRLRGGGQAAVLVASTFVVVSRFDSMAAIVAIMVGAAICVFAFWRARVVAWALAVSMALGAAAAPVLPRLPPVEALTHQVRAAVRPGNGIVSIAHRLEIWHFVAQSIAERPLAGWGLNSSRDLPGGIDEDAAGARNLPLHPHNAMLQWWLELGAVGATLGTVLVIFAALGAATSGSRSRVASAGAIATVAAGIVVALVGYGIWQAWWMAALWLAAALTAAIGPPHQPDPRKRQQEAVPQHAQV